MTIIAYARVSSTAQSLEIQEQQLHQAGNDSVAMKALLQAIKAGPQP